MEVIMGDRVYPGDVLFRWIDAGLPKKMQGDWKHKQIGIQQQRATETRRRYDVHTKGMSARLIKYTNVNIVHVGLCRNQNSVLEVGGSGISHNDLGNRAKTTDIVIRLNHATSIKLARLAAKVPVINYKKIAGGVFTGYPLGKVGIRPLGKANKNAQLVKSPTKTFKTSQDLNMYHNSQKKSYVDPLLALFDEPSRNLEKELKEIGFPAVICSHLVYALIYKVLRPAGQLMEALKDDGRFSVEPSRMWRDACLGIGLWQETGAQIIGVQNMGTINDKYTEIFKGKIESNLNQ
jgi:hypothetical protein